MKQFIAVRAIVHKDDKVLVIRESNKYADGTNAGKYDLPGGRLDSGENFINGLKREVFEETGIDIEVGPPIHVDEWRPVINGEETQIVGIYFICEVQDNTVMLSNDHDEFIWISLNEIDSYGFLTPARNAILEYFRNGINKITR